MIVWVSECVNEWEWLSVTECLWVSEWVSESEWEWVRVSESEWEWLSVSECLWVSEWVCEWIAMVHAAPCSTLLWWPSAPPPPNPRALLTPTFSSLSAPLPPQMDRGEREGRDLKAEDNSKKTNRRTLQAQSSTAALACEVVPRRCYLWNWLRNSLKCCRREDQLACQGRFSWEWWDSSPHNPSLRSPALSRHRQELVMALSGGHSSIASVGVITRDVGTFRIRILCFVASTTQLRSVTVCYGQSQSATVSHGQLGSVTLGYSQSWSATVSHSQSWSATVSHSQSWSDKVSYGQSWSATVSHGQHLHHFPGHVEQQRDHRGIRGAVDDEAQLL